MDEKNKVLASEKTIVLVDDDETITAFFNLMLSREGFKVAVFRSGAEAIEKLKQKFYKIDLIVLDLMMPGRGGYDVLKELQGTLYKEVPIFIVTARALDGGTVDMLSAESNVKAFWTKPVEPKEFKLKVHGVLGTARVATTKSEWDW